MIPKYEKIYIAFIDINGCANIDTKLLSVQLITHSHNGNVNMIP